jgi:hypothetical protein
MFLQEGSQLHPEQIPLFSPQKGYTLLRMHAVAQLVETLRYKPKFAGSIPDGVIDIIIPTALWAWV